MSKKFNGPRFVQIAGTRFRDLKTGRFQSRVAVVKWTEHRESLKTYWATVKRIKNAHPTMKYAQIRGNIKNAKSMGRAFDVDWFGDYKRAKTPGYTAVPDRDYYAKVRRRK
jgi:hypothetical protein